MSKLTDLSITSDKFIKFFLDNFPLDNNSCEFSSYTKHVCKLLFNKIKIYNKYLNLNKSKFLKSHLIKIESVKQIPKCELNSSRYVPRNVRTYIDTHAQYHLQYIFTCSKQIFKINFILFNDTDIYNLSIYDNYVHYILIWLLLATNQSVKKTCSKRLNIFIYMTDIKKEFPNTTSKILGASHVNSAVTRNCVLENNILIFRKEEWLKVLIHETFHTFSLDFSDYHDLSILNTNLKSIFNINSHFNAFESYSEFWAELINILIISFIFTKKKENFEDYWRIVSVILFYEIQFSLIQCVKVLNYMNLNYTDLFTSKGIQRYKENTNVFSYHILKTILIFNINDFLLWCKRHNLSLLQFNTKKICTAGIL